MYDNRHFILDGQLYQYSIGVARLGESDLAYFHKSKAYKEQQERRIILGESVDSLIKRGVGERYKDGMKIHIGSLSTGHIIKMMNF